ncbi:MAG TPA: hypothetical protein VG826_31120 [Pirellulales bacterium]|nr:hypothetical protein [Pirellulales bacterium]
MVDASDANNMGNWITNLSASGVLMWVVWYVLSKALPDIIKRHTEQNAADRQSFLDEMKTARQAFREEIAAERAHCSEELAKADERNKAALSVVASLHGPQDRTKDSSQSA